MTDPHPKPPRVLLISSTVATSRVGASAAAFCLQRLGIETVVLPTTLMGRHPGWGAPGGSAVSPEQLRDVWAGVKAQGVRYDGVLSGYMGAMDHVALTAEIIETVRAANPAALICVDPVMGDHGKLYIPEARAETLIAQLTALADFLTPNVWEHAYIKARQASLPSCLITSAPDGDKIGARWDDGETSAFVSHKRFDSVPHGGGDSLAALFLGRRLLGQDPHTALAHAVATVFQIMQGADALDAGELPLVRLQGCIRDVEPLEIRHD